MALMKRGSMIAWLLRKKLFGSDNWRACRKAPLQKGQENERRDVHAKANGKESNAP